MIPNTIVPGTKDKMVYGCIIHRIEDLDNGF